MAYVYPDTIPVINTSPIVYSDSYITRIFATPGEFLLTMFVILLLAFVLGIVIWLILSQPQSLRPVRAGISVLETPCTCCRSGCSTCGGPNCSELCTTALCGPGGTVLIPTGGLRSAGSGNSSSSSSSSSGNSSSSGGGGDMGKMSSMDYASTPEGMQHVAAAIERATAKGPQALTAENISSILTNSGVAHTNPVTLHNFMTTPGLSLPHGEPNGPNIAHAIQNLEQKNTRDMHAAQLWARLITPRRRTRSLSSCFIAMVRGSRGTYIPNSSIFGGHRNSPVFKFLNRFAESSLIQVGGTINRMSLMSSGFATLPRLPVVPRPVMSLLSAPSSSSSSSLSLLHSVTPSSSLLLSKNKISKEREDTKAVVDETNRVKALVLCLVGIKHMSFTARVLPSRLREEKREASRKSASESSSDTDEATTLKTRKSKKNTTPTTTTKKQVEEEKREKKEKQEQDEKEVREAKYAVEYEKSARKWISIARGTLHTHNVELVSVDDLHSLIVAPPLSSSLMSLTGKQSVNKNLHTSNVLQTILLKLYVFLQPIADGSRLLVYTGECIRVEGSQHRALLIPERATENSSSSSSSSSKGSGGTTSSTLPQENINTKCIPLEWMQQLMYRAACSSTSILAIEDIGCIGLHLPLAYIVDEKRSTLCPIAQLSSHLLDHDSIGTGTGTTSTSTTYDTVDNGKSVSINIIDDSIRITGTENNNKSMAPLVVISCCPSTTHTAHGTDSGIEVARKRVLLATLHHVLETSMDATVSVRALVIQTQRLLDMRGILQDVTVSCYNASHLNVSLLKFGTLSTLLNKVAPTT